MVEVSSTQTTEVLSTTPDGGLGEPSLRGLPGYNTESPTVDLVGNVFGECHAPCALKIFFCRFRKRVGALYYSRYKRNLFFVPTKLSILLMEVRIHWPG